MSETDNERFLDSDIRRICVFQRVAASAEDISTAEEKWKKLVEHQKEHVRMDSPFAFFMDI